ncbi:hypothetical protein CJ030_MR2G024116 [Morella rubra]|uniref:Uncharacterized protein n=1 Tax=Morella rubra TaxID=262757 RepID=A0A6A1WFF6_9ROSI|nr:hypothetical protein CJ030_MR2G024116 [Morella rubra]
MEELRTEVRADLARIYSFRQRMVSANEQPEDYEEEISALECMFEGFNMKISKYGHKKNEHVEPKVEIKVAESFVLA